MVQFAPMTQPERLVAELDHLRQREEELAAELEALSHRLQLNADDSVTIADVPPTQSQLAATVVDELKRCDNEFLAGRWLRAREAWKDFNGQLVALIERLHADPSAAADGLERLDETRREMNDAHEEFERVTAEVTAFFEAHKREREAR